MGRIRKHSMLIRQTFLELAGTSAGALALSGCRVLSFGDRDFLPRSPRAEMTGTIQEHTLNAAPLEFEVGGRTVQTWGYQGGVPGPEIRVMEGDILHVKLLNRLPADTTIHWHGLPVPNAMDGVPHLTQSPVRSGEDFTYEFVVPTAGTYVYHSHVGLHLDRGYDSEITRQRLEERGLVTCTEMINAAQQEHQCCSCHKLSNEAQCSCTNEVLEFRGGAHMTAHTKHPTVETAYLVAKDSPRV